MPVLTRINNNQVTDAVVGNAYLGVNAAAKVQSYSITSTLLSNNLVYGSDLTVTGNLTINGNTTTVDTYNLVVEDPLILLAKGQTGSPTLDIGFIGKRGTDTNIAFVWDEANDQFVTAYTSSETTNTTITISSYADLHTGNLTVGGTTTLTGNVASITVTGNVVGGNLLTSGLISAAGNVTGGNVTTAGQVTATGNVTGGNVLTGGLISATGSITSANGITATANITGGNILTAGLVSATGNITGNYYFGNGYYLDGVANAQSASKLVNGTSNVDIPTTNGNVTVGVNGTNNVLVVADSGTYITGVNSVSGNITGGNVLTGGLISATGSITSANGITATANVTGGNLTTGGLVTATGNVTGGNITTGGLVTASGNVIGSNFLTGGYVSATGNVTSGNVNTTSVNNPSGALVISASGNVTFEQSGNIDVTSSYINNLLDPVQDQDAATKIYVDNMVSTGLAYHTAVYAATISNLATTTGGTITYNQPNGAGNGIGATITTTGSFNLIDTANVQTVGTRILVKDEGNAVLNGVYVWGNATTITRSTDADTYGPNSITDLSINDYFFVQQGNVNKGSAWVVDGPTGTITFGTSNITFAQFSSSQTYTANTQAGISLTGTVFSALVDNNTTAFDGSGNIIVKAGANLTTPNIGAATGTSLSVTGNVEGGNLVTGGTVTATGTVTGGNISTGGYVTATGNVIGGNVTTAGLVTATGNVIGGNLLTTGLISSTGNVSSGNVNTGIVSATGNIDGANVNVGSGNVTGGNVSVTGNVYASNFVGNISGNIDAAGSNTQVQFNDTGDILGASANFTFDKSTNTMTVSGTIGGTTVSASANVVGGNITTGGEVTATGNVTGGNLITAGLITATGNVQAGNINTAGLVSATGNVQGAIILGGNAVFGTSFTQQACATITINATDSILMPVGNTLQRPSSTALGMLRFNTAGDAMEVYTSTGWQDVGVPAFTVITDQQFAGDGACTTFTLSANSTTAATIISINGVVQIPTTAYAVTGNSLVFTEAPAVSDTIDVRSLTTTTTLTGLENVSGNAHVVTLDTSAAVEVLGNLLPSGNAVYSLGGPNNYWKSLYVAGNTIYLGNLQLKEASANTFAIYTSDGYTQANIDVGSVDVSSINSGTSAIGIGAPNGNIYLAPAGANVLVAAPTGAYVTGDMSVTGNIVAQDVNSLSDAVLKTNIQPLTGVDSVISRLSGVEYDWKNGTGHSYGFLAQEVEKVLPSAVRTGADGLKSINYMMIIPFLVETIKQMGDEIKDLKHTVQKRRGKKN